MSISTNRTSSASTHAQTSGQTFCYRLPDVPMYEQQKGLVLARQESEPTFISDRESVTSVFADRIGAVLRGQSWSAPAIYPGSLIPSPGQTASFLDRGNLFRSHYEFFQGHGWFPDQGGAVQYQAVPDSNPGSGRM